MFGDSGGESITEQRAPSMDCGRPDSKQTGFAWHRAIGLFFHRFL